MNKQTSSLCFPFRQEEPLLQDQLFSLKAAADGDNLLSPFAAGFLPLEVFSRTNPAFRRHRLEKMSFSLSNEAFFFRKEPSFSPPTLFSR